MIKTKVSVDFIAEVVNLFEEESYTPYKISKKVGKSLTIIQTILNTNGHDVPVSKLISNDILREWFNQKKPLSLIAKELGITSDSVKRLLARVGLKYPTPVSTKKLSDYLIQNIVNDYQLGLSSRMIAKKYEISKTPVLQYLKKHNIEMKDNSFYSKYDFDKTFFDKIDTEEKAYFLGYLYADGYNNQKKGCVVLGQAEKDKESVYKLKNALKATHEIYIEENSKKDGNRQDFHKIVLFDKYFSDNLAKLGVVQGKTFDLTFPTFLSDDLIHHFIRGYFDGDGSIWESNGAKNMSITGFDAFIKGLQKHLVEDGDLNYTKLTSRRKNHIVDIRYGGSGNIKKIKDYLYKDASIYLQRKFEKF